jgi:hypothetical protein
MSLVLNMFSGRDVYGHESIGPGLRKKDSISTEHPARSLEQGLELGLLKLRLLTGEGLAAEAPSYRVVSVMGGSGVAGKNGFSRY